jgi:membrane protein implicated in regulation of membrane protease activity
MDTPETWRWIWLLAALVFAAGELVTPATFFFLPFALGAIAASAASFLGLPMAITWGVFVLVSGVAFASLWKLGRKLEHADEEQEGVGATRWVGQQALVVKTIGTDGAVGRVQLERENWRAESLTGAVIPKGSKVLIARLDGTRLVVVPVESPASPEIPFTQTQSPEDPNGITAGSGKE